MNNKFVKLFLLLGDVLAICASLYLTLLLRNDELLGGFIIFLYGFLPVYIFWIAVIFVLNLYDIGFLRNPLSFLFDVVIFSFVALFFGLAYFYLRPNLGLAPKTILILNIIVFDLLFLVWRWIINSTLEGRGFKDRIIIVGFKPELKEVFPQMSRTYEVVGSFCPPYLEDQNSCQIVFPGIDIVSNVLDLKKIISDKKVTSILIANTNSKLIEDVFSSLPLKINYVDFNDLYEATAKKIPLKYLDEAWFLKKVSRAEGKLEKIIKRTFDIFFSGIGILFFLLFLPFVSAGIKLSSRGRIFFTQKRVGENGKVFTMYKFRTLKETFHQDRKIWREKNLGDITGFGKFMRATHIDELPQAINILKGDISFVGPRAEWQELATIFEKEIPFYRQRYLVKPGLFGWAQINFPASKSVEQAREKFEYDLYYIKNHSLLLDLEIMFKAARLFFV